MQDCRFAQEAAVTSAVAAGLASMARSLANWTALHLSHDLQRQDWAATEALTPKAHKTLGAFAHMGQVDSCGIVACMAAPPALPRAKRLCAQWLRTAYLERASWGMMACQEVQSMGRPQPFGAQELFSVLLFFGHASSCAESSEDRKLPVSSSRPLPPAWPAAEMRWAVPRTWSSAHHVDAMEGAEETLHSVHAA